VPQGIAHRHKKTGDTQQDLRQAEAKVEMPKASD
jgi:hypothetical protein